MTQYTAPLVLSLVITWASFFGSAISTHTVSAAAPTQVIIEFTKKPAALKITAEGQRVATSGERVASAASANAAAAAEHVAFRVASAHIAFTTNHAYTHVWALHCWLMFDFQTVDVALVPLP